jgi:hypothetical protein
VGGQGEPKFLPPPQVPPEALRSIRQVVEVAMNVHQRMDSWQKVCLRREVARNCREAQNEPENTVDALANRYNESLTQLPASITAAVMDETVTIVNKLGILYRRRLGRKSTFYQDASVWLSRADR